MEQTIVGTYSWLELAKSDLLVLRFRTIDSALITNTCRDQRVKGSSAGFLLRYG